MEMIPLSAALRPKTSKAAALRRTGNVPCILYGFDTDNRLLACQEIALQKTYAKAGQSTLVDLTIEDRRIPVLFYAVSYDPVSDRMIHVDFYAVNMKKEVEATVPIHFTDSAPATKEV